MEQDFSSQPISKVVWVHRDELKANDYNPNWIPPPEYRLLELSLIEDGWTTPIVARENGEIVDGFHRWKLSGKKKVYALTDGMIPVVYLRPVDPAHQMLSTIRHNRARGAHAVLGMSDLVVKLLDEQKLTVEEVMKRLGMEREEVTRLYDNSGMPKRGGRDEFGDGWVPELEEAPQR